MASVRRVRRVIRKLDPWTVFEVALVLHVVFALATLIGLLILWSLLVRVGIPHALDEFLALTPLEDADQVVEAVLFNNGARFVRVAVFGSVVFGIMMTLLSTLAAVFYNMASDVVGGVEVVMLEETLHLPPAAAPVSQPDPDPDPLAVPYDQADLPTLAQ